MKRLNIKLVILICALFAVDSIYAQTNLLLNPNADSESKHWLAFQETTVEEFDGDKVFVVRNKGSFSQDVNLSETDVGKYALFIGHGSSERVNEDGAITGLPYLYGYMMAPEKLKNGRIYAHLQGQKMGAKPQHKDEWIKMFGIFQVPEGTGRIRFFLNQAERRGVPQNGSAARFKNLGLYLFETQEEALAFAKQYK